VLFRLSYNRMRVRDYEHVEPPSGADPDRPQYESGAAAVRGGTHERGKRQAAGQGFEP
jgi:hypothetical protein